MTAMDETVAAPRGVTQVQALLTERCNITCRHCAVPAEDSPAEHELSTAGWERLIDGFGAAGVESLVVNGGEAMLRRDAVHLLAHALDGPIRWATIITNGMLFTAPAARDLAALQERHPSLQIHVSIDGVSAETHDWMRGEGTFARLEASLGRLRDAGARLTGVNSVVHRGNWNEFHAMATFVDALGATMWTVFPNADLGRGRDLEDQRLDEAAWMALYERARRVEEELGLYVSIGGPVFVDEWPESNDRVPRPKVSHPDKVCIGPDGDAFTCPPLRHVSLGCAAGDDPDWVGIVERARDLLEGTCDSCKYLLVCTGVDLVAPLIPRRNAFGPPLPPGHGAAVQIRPVG